MMKNGRSHRLNFYTSEEIVDAVHSLERHGLVYSAIGTDGKLRWYAVGYGPKYPRKPSQIHNEEKPDGDEKL